MKQKSKIFSFRLPDHYARALMALAADRHVSPGDVVKMIVMDMLSDSDDSQLQQLCDLESNITSLRQEVATFRRHFALAVKQLLIRTGQTDEREARQFARKLLRGSNDA
jgi:hypothetical protein